MSDDTHELMTDEEVYELLRIGRATFYRHLSEGPPGGAKVGGDIRTIKRTKIGGARRWVRASVMEFAQLEESPQGDE